MVNTTVVLDPHAESPIYKQIVEQIKKSIAADHLRPGDHLPTIKQMASALRVNQNTVARAFHELGQEEVIITQRRRGSIVAIDSNDPSVSFVRQKRLSDIICTSIIRLLSLGYGAEEIEAGFHLQLARWREERRKTPDKVMRSLRTDARRRTICIAGSHDLALNILTNTLKKRDNKAEIQVTNVGSLGGLIALQEGHAHLAGIHLLDEETGEYNFPYIKRILPNTEIAVVHLVDRIQGLMFLSGNPKQIKGIADLTRPDITFINRQKGAGTRVLLDINLHRLGISASGINGYQREVDTHLAAGLNVVHGESDVTLGIEAAARSCNLDFLPLFRERYDLVIPMCNYRSRLLAPLLNIVTNEEFRSVINEAGGYDTTETGAVTFL